MSQTLDRLARVPRALAALREATRSYHAELAASPAMLRLFDPAYSISEYRAHLGRLLGLFEPLERAVAAVANPTDPVHGLQKSTAIREDLCNMGASKADIDALERCRRLPPIFPAGLDGYRYVVLGSRLGGRIIVKRLSTVLGADSSFHFYGDDSGYSEASWAAFCADLGNDRLTDVRAICATAVGIFDAYITWLSEPLGRHPSGNSRPLSVRETGRRPP